MPLNKEQIYDTLFSPLVRQLVALCQEHKIAMVMGYAIPTDERPDLTVTTALVGGEFPHNVELMLAGEALKNGANVTIGEVLEKLEKAGFLKRTFPAHGAG